jgi:hypothetical protein
VNIYLDTNLWNVLCDRAVDLTQLTIALAARKANLVLSLQTCYKLAKTFRSPSRKALQRGRQLISYFRQFVDASIPCAKENMELLVAEMRALKSQTSNIEVFLRAEDYALLTLVEPPFTICTEYIIFNLARSLYRLCRSH